MCGIKKKRERDTSELTYKAGTDSQTYRTHLWVPRVDKPGVWNEQIHTARCNIDKTHGPTVRRREAYTIPYIKYTEATIYCIAQGTILESRNEVSEKSLSRVRLFATPWTIQSARLLHPWDSLGKSTGVSCHFLFQGIFPTQGSNRVSHIAGRLLTT